MAYRIPLAISAFTALLSITATVVSPVEAKSPKRILVVTVTKGFRHDSIPLAESTLQALSEQSKGKFTVDYARTDEDLQTKMTADALKKYDAILFANTTGDLPLPDRDAFLKWVRDGHGFIGTHAASDTFHGYPAYISMLGGEFKTHGPQVEVTVGIEDPKHPATKQFPGTSFKVFEEIYEFKNFDWANVHSLLYMNAHPQTKAPGDYPVAWCRKEGKGRVFYTSLGHRQDVWNAPWFHDHLMGGILWTLGYEKGDDKPQKRVHY